MYFLYSLLLTLGFLFLLPRFLFDALRHGKYVAGFRERLGSIAPIADKDRPVIWLHCVSVGETQAARPLVSALRKTLPQHRIVVSTITMTGQALAREVFKNSADRVLYFPFDWGFSVKRSLARIDPAGVLLLETEIWPGFLRHCHERKIPVMVVNGRISERSFRRYRLIRPFIKRVLKTLELAVMQDADDAERIIELGMDPKKVFISGNLKFDAGMMKSDSATAAELQRLFHHAERPLILAASTHAPEERMLLDAYRVLRSTSSDAPRLMIAPRHPERFAEVQNLMDNSGFLHARRTTAEVTQGKVEADLILLDTIGELGAAYPLASVVFVGGSISKNGGHNILEPAAVGSCIVTGAHTFNFAPIVKEFVEENALIQLPPLSESTAAEELATVFASLLASPLQRDELKKRALQLVNRNLGATEKTLEIILPIFSEAAVPATAAMAEAPQKAHSA